MPLPILQKLLGHSSICTTALYWKNIYQEPDDDIGSILAGKKWLEEKGEQKLPEPPSTENFPHVPNLFKPPFTVNQTVIPNKKPIHADNSLSVPKTVKKPPGMLISEISPSTPEKFLLNNPSKNSDQ